MYILTPHNIYIAYIFIVYHKVHHFLVLNHSNIFWTPFDFFFFAGEKWQLSANISPMGGNLHTCYYQKVHEYLQVGVELESSLRMAESTATVAYQIDIPKADVVFRGEI